MLVGACVFLCSLSLVSQETKALKGFQIHRMSKPEGLPHTIVNTVYQDSRGFLWIGTLNGLARYDGYSMQVFRKKTGDTNTLSGAVITCISEDMSGNMWVGTQSDGLNRFERRSATWTRFTPSMGTALTEHYIMALACDSSGTMWIGTPTGLLQFDAKSSTFKEVQLSTSYRTVSMLWADKHAVYACIGSNTLLKLENGKQTQYTLPINFGFPAVPWIRSFTENKRTIMYIGTNASTENNVVRFDTQTGNYSSIKHPVSSSAQGERVVSTPMGMDDAKRMIVMDTRVSISSQSIITPIRIGLWEMMKKDSSVQSIVEVGSPPRMLVKDKFAKGVYWMPTLAGLYKIIELPTSISTFRKESSNPKGLNDSYVRSFAQDNTGTTWIATTTGLNTLQGNSIVATPITGRDSIYNTTFSSIRVNILYNDSREGILIGTNTGIYKLDAQKKFVYSAYNDSVAFGFSGTKSRQPSKVWSMYRDKLGYLWVGTNNDGLFRFSKNSKRAERFVHNPTDSTTINDNRIWSMHEDKFGRMWFGTERGVARWDEKKGVFIRYVTDPKNQNSICGTNIWNIIMDSKQNLWFGAYGDGISMYRYKTDDFESITSTQGLPATSIASMIEDNDGYLWIGTYDGLIKHKPGTNEFRFLHENIGLFGDEYTFKCAHKLPDGRLMFGGISGGMSILKPNELRGNSNPPPIAVTSFKVFDEIIARDLINGDTIELDYDKNVFTFEYAALDFNNPSANRYKHLLENVDRQWIQDEYRRYASYAGIQAGTYTFRIQASNSDDVWNQNGISIVVIIHPPWWGTWWFRAMLVITVLGSIVVGTRLYVRFKTRRADTRRAVVTSQMQALRAQMNPHFIFNALNSVQRLILTEDTNRAIEYLSKFARLVRMVLESTIHPFHSLKEEVEWLTLYLELEKLRYGDKMNFTITCDESLHNYNQEIPTMVIQPFVENAIRHGIFHKRTTGTITVSFVHQNNSMLCTINDDGVGRQHAKELTRELNLPTTSVGINSTTERLKLINESRKTNEHITLDIQDLYHTDGIAAGTLVTLQFPFVETEPTNNE